MMLSPEISAWREAVIRHCALRLRYQRAYARGNVSICDLSVLLARVEEAAERRRALSPDAEGVTEATFR
jgi:hypothetical protein